MQEKLTFTENERRVLVAAKEKLDTIVETIVQLRGITKNVFVHPDLSGFSVIEARPILEKALSMPEAEVPSKQFNGVA